MNNIAIFYLSILFLCLILFIVYLYIKYHNSESLEEKSFKPLKTQKGKYHFNFLDQNAFASLPNDFVFKEVNQYYNHSRSRTALKNWRKLGLITLDKENIYHKTELGLTYKPTF